MSNMLRGRHGNSECDGKHSGYCSHAYRAREEKSWRDDLLDADEAEEFVTKGYLDRWAVWSPRDID